MILRARAAGPLLALWAVVPALVLAGCTTAVRGHGSLAAGAAPHHASASPSPTATAPTSASDTVLHARNTMTAAPAITVHGVSTDHGTTETVDVSTGYADTVHYLTEGHAVIAVPNGPAVEETGVGLDAWLKAPAAYWTAFGVPAAAAHAVDNHWVKVPHDLPADQLLVNVTGLTKFLLPAADDDVATTSRPGQPELVAITDAAAPGATYLFEGGDQPRLVEIDSAVGALQITYPAGPVTATPPDPAQVVTLPGD